MFDDETDDVGQEVEAFCPRCKGDTTHIVVSRYEDEIRRVRCSSCDDIHAFRRPRGEDGDEPSEQPTKRKMAKAKPTWEQVMNRRRGTPRNYSGEDIYGELDIIAHGVFGMGFVSELIGQNKVEVTFQHDKRILIHNRRMLPLHQVLRQRQEAEAKARSDSKARGRDAGRAPMKPRIVKPPVPARTAEPELDEIDIPDVLVDEMPDVLPGSRGPMGPMGMGKPAKLSPRALKALEDDDEDESAEKDDAPPAGGKRRGRPPGATGAARAAEGRAAAPPADDEGDESALSKRKAARSSQLAAAMERVKLARKAAVAEAMVQRGRPEAKGKAAPALVPDAPISKAATPASAVGNSAKGKAKAVDAPDATPASSGKPVAPAVAVSTAIAAAKPTAKSAKGAAKPVAPAAGASMNPSASVKTAASSAVAIDPVASPVPAAPQPKADAGRKPQPASAKLKAAAPSAPADLPAKQPAKAEAASSSKAAPLAKKPLAAEVKSLPSAEGKPGKAAATTKAGTPAVVAVSPKDKGTKKVSGADKPDRPAAPAGSKKGPVTKSEPAKRAPASAKGAAAAKPKSAAASTGGAKIPSAKRPAAKGAVGKAAAAKGDIAKAPKKKTREPAKPAKKPVAAKGGSASGKASKKAAPAKKKPAPAKAKPAAKVSGKGSAKKPGRPGARR